MVTKLGIVGGVSRGAVVAVAGCSSFIAAVRFQPAKAEGIDGTLRAFAHTPLGPVLLILIALGLVAFGLFSWCEARWRRKSKPRPSSATGRGGYVREMTLHHRVR